jgi:hypothetical protein
MNNIVANVNTALKEIKELDVTGRHKLQSSEDRRALSLWIKSEYKKEFDRLQEVTNRKFGKLVQEVIMNCIDAANGD